MIPMVLILTDYFKVSISTTRLLNGNSVAGRNPAPPVIYKNLMNNDIYIYIFSIINGCFFQDFLPSTTIINKHRPFFTATFPRRAFRSASETEESWWSMEGSKSCLWWKVWGLHLSMRSCGSPKVEGAYDTYNIYIYTAIYIYIYDLAK